MAKLKPKIFVGCSSEARSLAQEFCDALSDVALLIPWWASKEFVASQSILTGLANASESYDFGLFLLTPDDKLQSHGINGMSARDNVLFEFGLFLGSIGAERTFAVLQDSDSLKKRVKLPSDLEGIILPRFISGDRDSVVASVLVAANALRPRISKLSRRHGRLSLAQVWHYDPATKTFSMTLPKAVLERNRDELTNKSLVLVAYLEDDSIAVENNTLLAISEPRQLPVVPGDIVLRADGGKVFRALRKGDSLTGQLLLVPSGCSIKTRKTIAKMLDSGCELLDRKGVKK